MYNLILPKPYDKLTREDVADLAARISAMPARSSGPWKYDGTYEAIFLYGNETHFISFDLLKDPAGRLAWTGTVDHTNIMPLGLVQNQLKVENIAQILAYNAARESKFQIDPTRLLHRNRTLVERILSEIKATKPES